jgi:choline dehydrogenase-like flavoprotein
MPRVTIIGSGASAVHFALTILRKGYKVLMLDAGRQPPAVVNPNDTLNDLKVNLADPVEYFLGKKYEAVIYPNHNSEYYGFPPSKDYVFQEVPGFNLSANGFSPLLSFAQGGLAEVWTGGVYPLNDLELSEFPFSYHDLEPYYSEVADRIGITGEKDDLARFYPLHSNLLPPLDLDLHSTVLLSRYEKRKNYFNNKLGCFLGRSRVATLSQNKGTRKACSYTGRCIWGCPSQSLYTPSITLNQCRDYSNFTYLPDLYVTHFKFNSKSRVTHIIAESLKDKRSHKFEVDKLVLAAGTLSSSKIFLDSIYKSTGKIVKLKGLMDNRQVLIPFVNLKMIGKEYNPQTYQYHQLAMGIKNDNSLNYIHAQITTLKTALIHPIIQNMPFDLETSTSIFRNIRAALGIINLNFFDRRRENNYITLKHSTNSSHSSLLTHYIPPANEEIILKDTIRKVKRAFLTLGCLIPPGVTHIRPMGASVHYAGTIPMSIQKLQYTASADCQSHDFDNLFIVDGTTFPFLPAKNLTFTLMANAIRVANKAF